MRAVIEHLAVKQQAKLQSNADAASEPQGHDTQLHVLDSASKANIPGAKTGVAFSPGSPPESGYHMLDQLAHKHPSVTLFFCDVVGFTSMSKEVEPAQVMRFLNELYTQYDALVDKYGVYKVETVGDCYVVAGGLMSQDDQGFAVVNTGGDDDASHSHAVAVYRFAREVLQVVSSDGSSVLTFFAYRISSVCTCI